MQVVFNKIFKKNFGVKNYLREVAVWYLTKKQLILYKLNRWIMGRFLALVLVVLYLNSCNTSKIDKEKYLKEGKKIAQSTGKLLTTKVKTVLKTQGPFKAIVFCNLNAYPLTDSLSNLYHAEIKRVALKYRNSKNKANEQEGIVLNKYFRQAKKGETLKPIVEKNGEQVFFYAPIKMQHACLACHGTPVSEIPDTLYNHIKELYPDDLATNFKEGDLRGMWSIRFTTIR